MSILTSVAELEALYGLPGEASTVKVTDRIIPEYRAFIEASPFVALATSGPEGLDCSPRGDVAGFVRIHDERTLMMPDRRGNNRTNSLRNIIRDPRCALPVPGAGVGDDAPRQRPRRCRHRRGALRVVRGRREDAALGDRDDRRRRSISSAPGRSSAPTCGIRRSTSTRGACRRRGASSRRSARTGSAARTTTAPGRSGPRRRCGDGVWQTFHRPRTSRRVRK